MTIVSILILAGIAGVIFTAVASALTTSSTLGFPRFIAFLVTMLGVLGLTGYFKGNGEWVNGLLIPYEAPVLTVLLILAILGLRGLCRCGDNLGKIFKKKDEKQDAKKSKDSSFHNPWEMKDEEGRTS